MRVYLRCEWIDDIRGQRFGELQEHYYAELEPRQRSCLFLHSFRQQRGLLVGMITHDFGGKKETRNMAKDRMSCLLLPTTATAYD